MKLSRLPLVLLAMLSLFTTSRAYTSDYYLIPNGADGDVALARQAFERFYRDLALNGHFDLSYNNNLTINTLLEGDVQKEGAIMLTLLNWLAHRKDHDSKFLLKRLNYLYFLELHNLFSSIDNNKDATARMLQLCDQFYHYKIVNPISQQTKRPFRTSLSRLFIVITTINGSDMAYENRKKSMALALERVGNKMLNINKRLGDQKMNPQDITAFVSLLATHVAVEPLVKTSIIKNAVLFTVITATIIALIYWQRESIGKALGDFATIMDQSIDKLLGYAGRSLTKGAIEGLTVKDATGKEILNPKVEALLTKIERKVDKAMDTVKESVGKIDQKAEKFAETVATFQEGVGQSRVGGLLMKAPSALEADRRKAAQAAQRQQEFEANQRNRYWTRPFCWLGYKLNITQS